MKLSGHRNAAVMLPVALWAATVIAAEPDSRLAAAVRTRDAAAVRVLLDQQVDVNGRQADGATALHWAAYWDELDIARALLSAGADVAAANDYGVTPLSLAAVNGSAEMIQLLLKSGADAADTRPSGETVLMTAARSGSLGAVEALIAAGADVNVRERAKGQTALMWAVAEGHVDVVERLIAHGADVSARSAGGFTPLMFAARQGSLALTELLLERGAQLNESDAEGATPLVIAAVRGHVALARYLLGRGADPNANGTGYTALHWASAHSDSLLTHDYPNAPGEWRALGGLPTQADKIELVKALIAHGADVNARLTKDLPRYGFTQFRRVYILGGTPFHLAAQAADTEVMRILLDAGADPTLRAADGTPPLVVAAGITQGNNETRVPETQHLEAVKFIVGLGVDINSSNENGYNALHASAIAGFDSVAQFLIDNGIKLNERTKGARGLPGQTALGIAEGSNFNGFFIERVSLATLLRRYGAISEGAVSLQSFMEQAERLKREQSQVPRDRD